MTGAGAGGGIGSQNSILVGAVVSLVGIASVIVECEVPSILPIITEHYAMSSALASWLMSIFTFVGVVVALPVGKIAALIEPHRLMLIGAAIILLGSVVAAIAPTSTILLIARIVQGVALVIIAVCGPALIKSKVHPSRLGTSMGIWAVGFSVGSTIAGVTTPFFSTYFGFKAVWMAYGVVTLVVSIMACIIVVGPSRGPSRGPSHRKATNNDKGTGSLLSDAEERGISAATKAISDKPRYREVFTRDTCLFLSVYMIFNMMVFAVVSYVPSVLQIKGYDPTLAGFISTLPMLLAIVSGPIMGIVYDRTGYIKPAMLVCMLVLGPLVFLTFNLEGTFLWIVVVLLGLIGMSISGVLLTTFLALLRRSEVVPLAMGVFTMIQGVGQFLGSFLLQALLGANLTNWLSAGLAMMISGFIASVAVFLCDIKRRPSESYECRKGAEHGAGQR
jgi:predicted MFS family arabinose efflux permease